MAINHFNSHHMIMLVVVSEIITKSGSNAGIGFAVPADQLRPAVDKIIRDDHIENGERPMLSTR